MLDFLQTVLLSLARLLCMLNYVPRHKDENTYEAIKAEDPKLQKEFKRMRIKELKYNKFQIKEMSGNNVTNHICSCKSNGSMPSSRNGGVGNNNLTAPTADLTPDMSPLHLHQGLENDVKEIKRYIKTIMYKSKHKEHMDKIKAEWRAVALVLDRMFFFLYVLSIIVSLATMFPRSA